MREGLVTRRVWLGTAVGSAFLTACTRKRATRYQGWMFVASGSEKQIAVINLSSFHRAASIELPFAADQLFRTGPRLFAVSRGAQAMVEVDVNRFTAGSKIGLPGKPMAARVGRDGRTALVITDAPAALVKVDLDSRRVTRVALLPGAPADLDLSEDRAAISVPGNNSLVRVSLSKTSVEHTDVGVPCTTIRFRRDGRSILAAATMARQVVTVDADSGRFLTRMGLPFAPARFCFNADGGQMFVTGNGEDALAIVSPFQNEVDQTILAGRTPAAMAVSDERNLLFVTNRDSGDLTILDIDTRGVVASVHVGENPGEVLLTPDGEYALVIDQRSGNVSVVRITTVLDRKIKTKPLFTVVPTAADPRSAVILPFET